MFVGNGIKMFYLIFDLMMALIMFLLGIGFYKSNGKAANFISGYNSKSEEERKSYERGLWKKNDVDSFSIYSQGSY